MKYLGSVSAYPLINIHSVLTANGSFLVSHRHISLLGRDAECIHVPLTPSYIDNLQRLGLVSVDSMNQLSDVSLYSRIEEIPEIKRVIENLNKIDGRRADTQKIRLIITDLGRQFIRACVTDKDQQQRN